MTNRIAEITARCEAATPGPWRTQDRGDYIEIHDNHTWAKALSPFARVEGDEFHNAAFIAHAREDIPYLLSQLAVAKEGCENCDIARRDFALSQSPEYVNRATMLDKIHVLQQRLAERDREIERLRKEVASLAIESIEREKTLAKLEAEVMQLWEAQRWTRVSERVPDKDDTVEAYNPVFGAFDAYYLDGWFTRGHKIRVTHWRVPAAPEEVEP